MTSWAGFIIRVATSPKRIPNGQGPVDLEGAWSEGIPLWNPRRSAMEERKALDSDPGPGLFYGVVFSGERESPDERKYPAWFVNGLVSLTQ